MEVPALLVQELLTLTQGQRLSALGLRCAFLPIEVGQLIKKVGSQVCWSISSWETPQFKCKG